MGIVAADIHVALSDSLFDFINPNALIHVDVWGDVVIHIRFFRVMNRSPKKIYR